MHEPAADWEDALEAALLRRPDEPLSVQRKRAAHAVVPRSDEATRERLRALCVEGLEAAGIPQPRLRLRLEAYPGLRGSLEQDVAGRVQPGERLTLTMSDGYAEAPDAVVRGLAASLGVRMFSKRRKVPELAAMMESFYTEWQGSREARELQTRLRRARARKEGRGPKGDTYDLALLTGRVAARFLGGRLPPVKVTWSSRRSYSVLGHHDGDLDTVVVSKALDHPDVPESLVAYVLYHELLHHVMGIQEGPNHTRRMHPPAFRRRERRFPHWATHDAYLSAMCGKRQPIPRAKVHPGWRVLWDEPWDAVAPKATAGSDGRADARSDVGRHSDATT